MFKKHCQNAIVVSHCSVSKMTLCYNHSQYGLQYVIQMPKPCGFEWNKTCSVRAGSNIWIYWGAWNGVQKSHTQVGHTTYVCGASKSRFVQPKCVFNLRAHVLHISISTPNFPHKSRSSRDLRVYIPVKSVPKFQKFSPPSVAFYIVYVLFC